MRKKVTALEARRKLGELLEGVYYRADEVTIERDGKPMAVLVPVERFEAANRGRERFWDAIERLWDAAGDDDPEAIEQDIAKALREVRADRLVSSNAEQA